VRVGKNSMKKHMYVSKNLITIFFVALSIGGVDLELAYSSSNQKESRKQIETDHTISYKKIDREKQLKEFLEDYNSPLANNADKFVEVADKYDMDYRLLPAISCLESSCGKFLIPNTYNPFGWGIYGDNYIAFTDYDEAIETVGKGLHEGYIQKGAKTIEQIAPIYNPPNPSKWGHSVRFFMNRIDQS